MAGPYPPDRDELRRAGFDEHVHPAGSILWRIHPTASAHPMPWNALRTFGPLPTARWDPHPLPQGDYSPLGSAYLGADVLTCLGEVFQDTRFIDVDRGGQYVTAFEISRELRLADLTGTWPVKMGLTASAALQPRKELTQAWARAIHEARPDLDGVFAPSAVIAGRNVTALWTIDAIPAAPKLSMALNSPAISTDLMVAAAEIGFGSNIVV